jgi:hypothetical protein
MKVSVKTLQGKVFEIDVGEEATVSSIGATSSLASTYSTKTVVSLRVCP